ncbi:MAG: hypothetical protein ACI9OJ_005471 [Myxococcota bacterium]|jgi:hypothetical protein
MLSQTDGHYRKAPTRPCNRRPSIRTRDESFAGESCIALLAFASSCATIHGANEPAIRMLGLEVGFVRRGSPVSSSPFFRETALRFIQTVLLLSLAACATTEVTPQPAEPVSATTPDDRVLDATEISEIKAAARQFADAKLAQDFPTLWTLTAQVYRDMIREIGRLPAEQRDSAAKAQGFASAAAVKALTDADYFVANRRHLAKAKRYVYPQGVQITALSLGEAITLPFDSGRVVAHRIKIGLSNGDTDVLGAIREGAGWRFLER